MKEKVVAITVTYNRFNTLEKNLEALEKQIYPIEKIIVVDNNSNDENKNKLKNYIKNKKNIEVIWKDKNYGGAGGFHYGVKHAYENYNVDWYWIMDDDAYPRTDCLKKMLENSSKKDIGFLAPSIFGIDYKEYQTYHHKKITKNKCRDLTLINEYKNFPKIFEVDADAFVGPMFSRKAIKEVGFPDKDLFIYGDDVEYTFRVTRKFKGYIVKNAIIDHQDVIVKNGVSEPKSWWKNYYSIRNRIFFVYKYAENPIQKFLGISYMLIQVFIAIAGCLIKKDYKNYRKLRLRILFSALKDGLNNKSGKTLDPNEYFQKLESVKK